MRCIAPFLILKPYSDLQEKIGFVHRLGEWGQYGEAEEAGFGVLDELQSRLLRGGKDGRRMAGDTEPSVDHQDSEFASDIVILVCRMVRCVHGKAIKDCRTILDL